MAPRTITNHKTTDYLLFTLSPGKHDTQIKNHILHAHIKTVKVRRQTLALEDPEDNPWTRAILRTTILLF